VAYQRFKPARQVAVRPVGDRPLGQVGEITAQPGRLAIKDETSSRELPRAVEPTKAFGGPAQLDTGPARAAIGNTGVACGFVIGRFSYDADEYPPLILPVLLIRL
jgi:hypothetical protein